MSWSLTMGAIYVLCAAVVALLPIRQQYWPAGIMLLAFLSMFCNPLRYLWKKSRGVHVELPE